MVLERLKIEDLLPATFTAPGLREEQFLALWEKFPDAFLEYTADGTVIVMPPTDPESGVRSGEIIAQLSSWARVQGQGLASSAEAGFRFPSGARRSPDAAWFNAERWREAKRKQPRLRFPVFAPEFVIEVRPPDDRMRNLREKMEEYISDGVLLGWLIDPFRRAVEIYRPGQEPELLEDPPTVAGEGPVAGFVLSLERIFTA